MSEQHTIHNLEIINTALTRVRATLHSTKDKRKPKTYLTIIITITMWKAMK